MSDEKSNSENVHDRRARATAVENESDLEPQDFFFGNFDLPPKDSCRILLRDFGNIIRNHCRCFFRFDAGPPRARNKYK